MKTLGDPTRAARESLRPLLTQNEVVYAPGAWDGLTSLLVERAGYAAICSSGLAIAASMGYADADLYGLSDATQAIRRIARTTSRPIIADLDTGYGNAVNVFNSIQEFEAAGAAAVYMEDQVFPKRESLTGDGQLQDIKTSAMKVKAAVEGRTSMETVIIARTEASGDEILRRAVAYAEAGADMIMPIALSEEHDRDAFERVHAETGLPVALVGVAGNWKDRIPDTELFEMGIRIKLLAAEPAFIMITALEKALPRLRDLDDRAALAAETIPVTHYLDLLSYDTVSKLSARFAADQ